MNEINKKEIEVKKEKLQESFEREFPLTFEVREDYGYVELNVIKNTFWLTDKVLPKISIFIYNYNKLLTLQKLADEFFPEPQETEE